MFTALIVSVVFCLFLTVALVNASREIRELQRLLHDAHELIRVSDGSARRALALYRGPRLSETME